MIVSIRLKKKNKLGYRKSITVLCNKTSLDFSWGSSKKNMMWWNNIFYNVIAKDMNSEETMFHGKGSLIQDFNWFSWAPLGKAWDTHEIVFVLAKRNLIFSLRMSHNHIFTNSTNYISVPCSVLNSNQGNLDGILSFVAHLYKNAKE